jgi:energy-coupling factor transport system permease protein
MERIDPRARWIFSLLFLFAVTMFWDLRFLLVFFGMAATWYSLARTSFHETRRGWTFVLFLLSMMVLVNTILTGGGAAGIVQGEGHPIWSTSFTIPVVDWTIEFTLTVERLWFGLCQIVRVLSISAIFLIIPYSMDPRLYGFTFRGVGFPDRFAFSMDLAFRYVPTLARDFQVTLDAQKARGYELERVEGGLITQVKRIAPLVVPVTMGAILGGEDMANAMDLRCFGLKPRTWVHTTQYRWWDFALIAFSVLLLLGSFVLRYVVGVGSFWVPDWILPG